MDSLVAIGTADRVAARITEQLDAGADHVCVQLIAAQDVDLECGFIDLATQLIR